MYDTSQLDNLAALEVSIHRGNTDEARKVLRRILFSLAGTAASGDTIGDALAFLARAPADKSLAAIILLRCFAVQNLIPEPNSTNQIIRSSVELCEGAIPDVIGFLKIEKRAQNFEKFSILRGFHSRITEILSPLRSAYGDLDALLHASHEILGSLNHGMVRKYAEPYNLKEVRTALESLLGKLRKVSSLRPTLLLDIEDCNRAMNGQPAVIVIMDDIAATGSTLSGNLAKFISDFGHAGSGDHSCGDGAGSSQHTQENSEHGCN
jgi:hypothetical protein